MTLMKWIVKLSGKFVTSVKRKLSVFYYKIVLMCFGFFVLRLVKSVDF